MRKRFIGGNWKMHGTIAENEALIHALINGLQNFNEADVVVFPPCVYLWQVSELLQNTSIKLGAQNMNENGVGAYTGEVSADMLTDIACPYVILGHSERRQIYGEASELIAQKCQAALKYGLTPVLCVGETIEEREAALTESIVMSQLEPVLAKIGIEGFDKLILAYEPVWAIGTGLTATPEQANAVHAFIRKTLAKHDAEIAQNIRIIYGGSVKGQNASDLFAMPDIDGGLIGGASLKAEDFIQICRCHPGE